MDARAVPCRRPLSIDEATTGRETGGTGKRGRWWLEGIRCEKDATLLVDIIRANVYMVGRSVQFRRHNFGRILERRWGRPLCPKLSYCGWFVDFWGNLDACSLDVWYDEQRQQLAYARIAVGRRQRTRTAQTLRIALAHIIELFRLEFWSLNF